MRIENKDLVWGISPIHQKSFELSSALDLDLVIVTTKYNGDFDSICDERLADFQKVERMLLSWNQVFASRTPHVPNRVHASILLV